MKTTFFLLVLFVLGFQSCLFPDLFPRDKTTVVTGTVYNSITNDKISGLPIEIIHVSGVIPVMSDSFTTVYSNADGMYQARFSFDDGGYLLRVASRDYAPAGSGANSIKSGRTNVVNLKTVPFKVLQVHIKTSKQQRNSLYVEFQKWDTTKFFVGGDFEDTVKSRQNIDTVIFYKVYPMTNYLFDKFICNRELDQNKNIVNQDCIHSSINFYFNFVDTAKVVIE